MSITPTPISALETDWTWVKTHVMLLVVIAVLVVGSVYGIELMVASRDAQRASADQQILTAVTNQTKELQQRMTQDEQQEAVRDAQYNQTITQLSAIISNQSTQLQRQIKTNATLTAVQTAQALTQKTKAQPGEISATGDNVTVDLPIARVLNSDIDTMVTTKTQLAETRKQLDAETALKADAQVDAANAKLVIASQQTEIASGNKTCQDQITALKAQARKGKLKWFFVGVLAGLGIAHPLGI